MDKQQVLRLEIPNILNVPLKTKSNRNISISQLIVSLEKRLMDLSETLQMVRDGFVKKSAELEDLQRRSNDKVSSFEGRKWHFEVLFGLQQRRRTVSRLLGRTRRFPVSRRNWKT